MELWSFSTLADLMIDALKREAGRRDRAQEIYGLDAIDRFQTLALLNKSFTKAGYGTELHRPFPGKRSKFKCDLVLTPDRLPMHEPDADGTLFGTAPACWVESACWLNLQTVLQFTDEGANAAYSRQFFGPVMKAARQLAVNPMIYHAACLITLFCNSEETGRHDLTLWQTRGLNEGIPISAPVTRSLDLRDRMGNSCLVLAAFPIGRMEA